MTALGDNIAALRKRLGSASLIAVSKTQSIEAVREALEAGQRVFGENRVQEAQGKFPALLRKYPDMELHLIGALQTNKARQAVELFDVIQTLDRPQLAEALAEAMRKTVKTPDLYIEVNIGNEPQKAGIAPDKTESFLAACRDVYKLSVTGLMCIPPEGGDPRPYFRAMRGLADRFDIDFKQDEPDREHRKPKAPKQALLNQLSLEQVPGHGPIEMLVVERAKN